LCFPWAKWRGWFHNSPPVGTPGTFRKRTTKANCPRCSSQLRVGFRPGRGWRRTLFFRLVSTETSELWKIIASQRSLAGMEFSFVFRIAGAFVPPASPVGDSVGGATSIVHCQFVSWLCERRSRISEISCGVVRVGLSPAWPISDH
jgi:hypothetical protein